MPSHQELRADPATVKHLGAYGLRFLGLADEVAIDLSPVPAGAPAVRVEVRLALDVAAFDEVGPDHVFFAHARGPRYEFRRSASTALMSLPAPPDPRAVVHPLLTLVGSVFGRWRGSLTLHGGAFVLPGGAWAVLAEKDGGKSTTLAGLLEAGVPVLADDLVVVEAGRVLAGPRSVDLRPGAAKHLGRGEHIGFIGGRHRHRLQMPEPPASAPLAGLLVLEWTDVAVPHLEEVGMQDKLRLLYRHQAMSLMGPPEADAVLALLPLPMLRLRRPQRWDIHDRVTELLRGLG